MQQQDEALVLEVIMPSGIPFVGGGEKGRYDISGPRAEEVKAHILRLLSAGSSNRLKTGSDWMKNLKDFPREQILKLIGQPTLGLRTGSEDNLPSGRKADFYLPLNVAIVSEGTRSETLAALARAALTQMLSSGQPSLY